MNSATTPFLSPGRWDKESHTKIRRYRKRDKPPLKRPWSAHRDDWFCGIRNWQILWEGIWTITCAGTRQTKRLRRPHLGSRRCSDWISRWQYVWIPQQGNPLPLWKVREQALLWRQPLDELANRSSSSERNGDWARFEPAASACRMQLLICVARSGAVLIFLGS